MKTQARIPLGALEREVMEFLWRKGEATVREAHEEIRRKRDLAYTTVMTVMTRLLDKKILCRKELTDGSFLYKPCLSREEFYIKTSRAIFGELIRSFGPVAVAQFVDVVEEVDPRQLEALRRALKKK